MSSPLHHPGIDRTPAHQRRALTLTIVVSLLALSTAALAQQHPHSGSETVIQRQHPNQHPHHQQIQHQQIQHHQQSHGDLSDPQAHLAAVAKQLELSEAQSEALDQPLRRALEALTELHAAHDQIVNQLDADQRARFGELLHSSLRATFAGDPPAANRHQGDGERHRDHRGHE